MNRLLNRLSFLLFVIALGAFAVDAHAGGLYLPGYGSQAQPRAGAFTAKADDPTALFHNPAGLAKQAGTAIHLGFNFVDFSQAFTRDGAYEVDPLGAHPWEGQTYAEVTNQAKPSLGLGSIAAIPLLGVTSDLGLDLPMVFGVGFIAAHGYPFRDLGTDYIFEDPNTPPPITRYDIIEQEAVSAHFTFGAGYAISDRLSAGITLAWGIAELKARKHVWGIRNYEEAAAADGEVRFDAKDNFVPGFGVGILFAPTPMFEFGASYRSASKIEAKGTVRSQLGTGVGLGGEPDVIIPVDDNERCQTGGTVAALRGCLNVTLPQSAAIGGRFVIRDGGIERGDIELDLKWEDWSNGSDFVGIVDGESQLLGRRLEDVVTRHGFRDTLSVRLGGSYSLPISESDLIFRGGIAYDTAAAPNKFTRIDIDGLARTTIGAGVGLAVSRYRIDLGAGAVIEGTRTVPTCNPTVDTPGCDGSGTDRPVADRDRPDPEQPLQGPNNQTESPYNAGRYEQGYVLFSLGFTSTF